MLPVILDKFDVDQCAAMATGDQAVLQLLDKWLGQAESKYVDKGHWRALVSKRSTPRKDSFRGSGKWKYIRVRRRMAR